jgi:FAD/FMN-containing dehydrogenase
MTTPDGMKVLAFIVCWAGDPAEGEKALAPLRSFGPPVADMIAPMPYTAMQSMLDEGFPAGQHVYWRAHFLKGLTDETLATLIDRSASAPSPLNAVLIEQMGGAVARVGRDETAFDHRDAPFNFAIIARWTEPSEADANIAWARELWDATAADARGAYVNYLGVGDSEERVRAAYGPEKYGRLAALKARWDPENFFRFNQNIKPAQSR